jgi:hypothetical protein
MNYPGAFRFGQIRQSAETHHARERRTDYEIALDKLDRLSGSINPADIIDTVGVLADIKPASIIDYSPDLLDVLDKLGLSYCELGRCPEAIDDLTLSKDPRISVELATILTDEEASDDKFRRIGTLLGYPESAIEYFIRRSTSIDKDDPDEELPAIIPKAFDGTVHDEFCQFILSPEHWREEVEAYALPLEAAVRDMAPKTFRRIDRAVKTRKVVGSVLGIVGIKQPSFSDVAKVHYVS